MMFHMSKPLRYIMFLFIVVIAAAQTANAQSVSVELAEKTPPADPGDPTMTLAGPPPTTTTTTTLPTIPRCPDGIAGAETGSQDGYNYWSFVSPGALQSRGVWGDCVLLLRKPPDGPDEKRLGGLGRYEPRELSISYYTHQAITEWADFAAQVSGAGASYPETCYICGCYRAEGCFAPGVKITMADGSLRKIEDVRAGDIGAKREDGRPVKVGQVIEGPEALPLIRFGFDGATVTTSQAHPVLTAAGLKPANELKKGDTIFDAQGNPHALTILEMLPIEEGQRVINVNLDAASSDADQRLIVSDGIITGDIVLQGLLKERKIDAR